MVDQLGCPGRRIGQSHRTFRLSPRGISLHVRDKKSRTPVVVYFVSKREGQAASAMREWFRSNHQIQAGHVCGRKHCWLSIANTALKSLLWVRNGGPGFVRRPSGLPSVADVRCREPPLRAQHL
jgi:hypothetical protein